MKVTSVVLPILVAAASPAAAFTRVFLSTATVTDQVEFLSDSACKNADSYFSEAITKIDVEDLLRCMVYDQKDCVGNEVVTQGIYSVGQAPENLSSISSFWCYPTFW
ncbi:hypothetical protein PENSPDRAFT_690009 [Peniophora sp. CONT]|nr:hypothetical protein PENSPDRAFT_690009 [Peniophora sp. CONT]